MLRKLTLALTILAMSVCTVNAQKAANNWHFGRGARIDFNPTSPVATAVTTINTLEGSSSISDSNGSPLFHTDGIKVWDKNNNQMPNGFGLLGNPSSTHSALIVPCSCDKYFIFTTDARENNYSKGVQYSVVDMNAGTTNGDVIVKNVPLLVNASEKLAGVSDGSGGFWVVAHSMGNNRFFSYHIVAGNDCKLDPEAAIISPVGSVYPMPSGDFGQGQMKFSPNGNLLAVAGLKYGSISPVSFVELFKFNTNTGVVSNVIVGSTSRDTSPDGFYGVEFSPDSQSLYATTMVVNNFLYRYNITSTGLSSRTTVNNYGSVQYTIAALQLAPNGTIYIARKNQPYLDFLPTPNLPGGGWTANTHFNLASGTISHLGLPTMVAGNFSCGPTPDVCCDKMRVSPALNPPLTQDFRTFEIYNFKQPASPICSIDISMQPLPHTVTWQGGMATWLNSSGISNALPISPPPNFIFPYTRLPTTGNIAALSVPSTSPAVKFNLGFDNTQAYNGITKLTINHCDGTKCVLEYKPWIVNPSVGGGDIADSLPWRFEIRELSAELLELTLTYQGSRGRTALPQGGKGAKWLSLRLLNESAEIYALGGAEAVNERSKKFDLSSSSKTANAALFEFNGLLNPSNREQIGRTITLLIRKKGEVKIEPKELSLRLYNENVNLIMIGTPQR